MTTNKHVLTPRLRDIIQLVEGHDYLLSFNQSAGISCKGWNADHWGTYREENKDTTRALYDLIRAMTPEEVEALKATYINSPYKVEA